MHWITAVEHARAKDVSYEEWCDLYYDHKNPTKAQVEKASDTAHQILVREGHIKEGDRFIGLNEAWIES